jgi:hypothetical protein
VKSLSVAIAPRPEGRAVDLSEELAVVCGVRFLAHEEECLWCDIGQAANGILRLCPPGRELFGTWLLATLNEPEEATA